MTHTQEKKKEKGVDGRRVRVLWPSQTGSAHARAAPPVSRGSSGYEHMGECQPFLSSSSSRGTPSLMLGSEPIFLNGINLAWVRYPDLSGEDHMATLPSVCGAEEAMRFLVANGGNALRVWLLQGPRNPSHGATAWSRDSRRACC